MRRCLDPAWTDPRTEAQTHDRHTHIRDAPKQYPLASCTRGGAGN